MDPLQKIQMIFRDFFDDPSLVVSPQTSPGTLPDWDSVAQIQIVLALEETFDLRFTTDEVAGIHHVGDLLRIVAAHG